jgi:AbrB family looped-hinge helix DNA binding protein
MNALVSTMTQKGQVTIPKDVRDSLHLVTGDKVEFIVNDRNEIVIKPVTRKVMEVAGLLSKYKKAQPVSVEEMNQLVEQSFEDEKQ